MWIVCKRLVVAGALGLAWPALAQESFSIEQRLGTTGVTSSRSPTGDSIAMVRGRGPYPYGRLASRPVAGGFALRSDPSHLQASPIPWVPEGGIRLPAAGIATRVIGGVDVTPGELPWQVQLEMGESGLCGGSLIDPEWVLTAAHCVIDEGYVDPPEALTVLYGNTWIDDGTRVAVVAVHPHPDYLDGFDESRQVAFPHDIALLQLARPVRQTTIDLMTPTRETDLDRSGRPITTATVSGWGRTSDGSAASETLKRAQLDVFHIDECQRRFWPEGVWDWHICSGTVTGDRGSCQGDSGGPLTARLSGGQVIQVGIVSFGDQSCEARDSPGVFTRVASYHAWISRIIGVSPGSSTDGNMTAPQVQVGIRPNTRVRLGTKVQFEVRTDRPGFVLLIDINADGEPNMLFPNPYADTGARLRAGQSIRVPDAEYGFGIVASEPAGAGLLFAIVSDRPLDSRRTLQVTGDMARGFVAQARAEGRDSATALDQAARALFRQLSQRLGDYGRAWSGAYLDYEILR